MQETNKEIEEPFTNVSLVGVNLERMQRTVYCKYCFYIIETNLPGVQCGMCHAPLITYLQNRNNELA